MTTNINRLTVQSGIDSLGLMPSVVNEMRNKAFYINVPAAALPPQLSVVPDAGAPNARLIRGRLDGIEVSGTAYLAEPVDATGEVFKAMIVAFEPGVH